MHFSPIQLCTSAYVWPTGESASRPAGAAGGAAYGGQGGLQDGQDGQYGGYVGVQTAKKTERRSHDNDLKETILMTLTLF